MTEEWQQIYNFSDVFPTPWFSQDLFHLKPPLSSFKTSNAIILFWKLLIFKNRAITKRKYLFLKNLERNFYVPNNKNISCTEKRTYKIRRG